MSNSIWKMPDQKPERTGNIVYVLEDGDFGNFFYIEGKDFPTVVMANQFCFVTEDTPIKMIKWTYLADLIAQADKAEQLQKAVDFLSGHLRDVLQLDEYGHIKLGEITKQQIKTAISDPVGIIMQLEQESNN